MTEEPAIRDTVEAAIDAYEERLAGVAASMEKAAELLADFRSEQEALVSELRDLLARNESLRKKDFDLMVGDVVAGGSDAEERVTAAIHEFRREEEEMVAGLRAVLSGELPAGDETWEVFKERILGRQRQRERETTLLLKQFHLEQEEVRGILKKLLAKGPRLRTSDLKCALKAIRASEVDRAGEFARALEECERAREDVGAAWQRVVAVSNPS